MALLTRIQRDTMPNVPFRLDGRACFGRQGDTVLTAILTLQDRLRPAEFGTGGRAGFCLIGACQDCWVATRGGGQIRACSTLLEAGMELVTTDVATT